ncbi:MAG: PAS domain-containing protein, partial [Rhizobiaceae bacterium]
MGDNTVKSCTRVRQLSAEDGQSLLEISVDWLWATDDEFRFVCLSEGFEATTGVASGDLLWERGLDDFIAGGRGQGRLSDLAAKGPFKAYTCQVPGARESARWASLSGFPILDPTGAVIGYRGTGRNVTTELDAMDSVETLRLQADRNADRARLSEAVINAIEEPVFVKDAELRFAFCNKAFATLFGKEPRDIIGKSAIDIVSPEEASHFEESERHVLTTGEVHEAEEDYNFGGQDRSRLLRKSLVTAKDGRRHVACFLFDVTEMRRREAQLRAAMFENELFRNITDNVPVAIYAKTEDMRLCYVNRGWESLTGLPSREAIGKSDTELFGTDGNAFLQDDQSVLETREPRCFDEIATAPDGKESFRIAHKNAITASDGSIFLIGSTTDVTEMKNTERALRVAQEKAILADRAKSEFLANMSHEIRTPMNGVLGMAELLSRTDLDSKQKTFTDIIVKSGNALLTIINDILDFSKIDAGQLVLDPAPFNLAEAIEDVATLVSTRAKEKELELIVRVEPGLPAMFVGDVGRIRQIVTNLLGNAVKFTEQGHVLVEVIGNNDGEKTGLTLRVIDTGIGIPEDKLGQIFEKFSQVDASSTRRHEGTGLGLAITSRLIELMDGRISATSEPGKGSAFTVELTLPNSGSASNVKTMPVDVTGSRVLIIDDNEVNRSILMEQMQSWGFDACAAQGGREGIAVLSAVHKHGMAVDCVVLDYQMPEMTGGEVTRIIRSLPDIAETPIVLLTSVDHALARADTGGLGINAHLIKPARSSALLEAIVSSIQKGRARMAEPQAAAPPP